MPQWGIEVEGEGVDHAGAEIEFAASLLALSTPESIAVADNLIIRHLRAWLPILAADLTGENSPPHYVGPLVSYPRLSLTRRSPPWESQPEGSGACHSLRLAGHLARPVASRKAADPRVGLPDGGVNILTSPWRERPALSSGRRRERRPPGHYSTAEPGCEQDRRVPLHQWADRHSLRTPLARGLPLVESVAGRSDLHGFCLQILADPGEQLHCLRLRLVAFRVVLGIISSAS